MTFGGFEYLAFGPQGDGPAKLVVLLHGYGRNARYMEKMAQETHAVFPSATIVCPHAPDRLDHSRFDGGDGNFFRAVPEEVAAGNDRHHSGMLREWFPIDGDLKRLYANMRPAAERLNMFIDRQRDMAGVTDSDIAIMGFSQGGGMALYAGLTRARPPACIVAHSCIVLSDRDDGVQQAMAAKPPVLFIHGDRDTEFSSETYDRAAQWIAAATGNRMTRKIIAGMGHYTNAESRKISADYIAAAFSA